MVKDHVVSWEYDCVDRLPVREVVADMAATMVETSVWLVPSRFPGDEQPTPTPAEASVTPFDSLLIMIFSAQHVHPWRQQKPVSPPLGLAHCCQLGSAHCTTSISKSVNRSCPSVMGVAICVPDTHLWPRLHGGDTIVAIGATDGNCVLDICHIGWTTILLRGHYPGDKIIRT